MTENTAPSTHTDAVRAARDVLEWLEQHGHMLGLDVDVAHRGKYVELRTSDLRTLIAAAHRVPPVPYAETGACYVLVARPGGLRDTCGAVMWIDPAGDMNSNWRCAAGHDETTPDA